MIISPNILDAFNMTDLIDFVELLEHLFEVGGHDEPGLHVVGAHHLHKKGSTIEMQKVTDIHLYMQSLFGSVTFL